MKKMIIAGLALFLIISTACSHNSNAETSSQIEKENNKRIEYAQGDFTYEAIPETFTLKVTKNGTTETIAEPQEKRTVTNLKKTATETSWDYPDDKLHVTIKKEAKSLAVSIHSTNPKTSHFEWPRVDAPSYTLPISEGKQIPQNDSAWKKYFSTDGEQTMNEYFSMKFFTLNKEKFAVSYVMPDTYNNDILFQTNPAIQFSIKHTFSSVNKEKDYKYQIFITDNDPVAIAKNYQNYIKDQHQFTTLAEKEKQNPEIKKLYGAPHAYLWNSRVLTEEDVHWNKLKTSIDNPLFDWIGKLLDKYGEDGSTEYRTVLNNIKNGELYQYEKNMMLNAFQYTLQMPQLYNPDIFKNPDATAKKYIDKGIKNLNEQELYDLNKHLIGSHIEGLTTPINDWGQSNSTSLIKKMEQAGIKNAWIGLPNWVNGLMNPLSVDAAAAAGYLVGPYDSYQSIQQDASIDWNTASFPDPTLYENATVENEQGDKLTGFLGKGRKLNPTLVFNAVKTRVDGILAEGIGFNSWFMDVDAAGELHDDFAKAHPTTQKEDAAARMKRLDYLNNKGFVIGSEGGNDYAASHIAFAHGLETPVIKWDDPDMRENEDSPYFVGKYGAMDGKTPTRYSKIVPIKDEYKPIYTSPVYSIPLFKLVYNRSVITTHHWEWDSYKIKNQSGERRLKEYLYNTPPLFHLDEDTWKLHQDDITANMKNWTPFQQEALKHEMTNFQTLDSDRLVQKTEFGSKLQVIANFSNKDFSLEKNSIPAHTALIINDGKITTISTDNLD
ncbi:glycoside hydrolase [Listeria rocourtiae]|uniref:glycoside hydrolase n=1 Tax=Listeria rocourtiae TaxID=647910 RepID=UPI003D2F53E9